MENKIQPSLITSVEAKAIENNETNWEALGSCFVLSEDETYLKSVEHQKADQNEQDYVI